MKYVLSADVGGTRVRIGLIDENYDLVASDKVFRKDVMGAEHPAADLADFMADWAAKQGREIAAVAAGFPATLDAERKVVLSTPNIPGMNNQPFTDILSSKLGVPAFIERDVSMLFMCDKVRYNIPDEGIAVGIYMGTGIGNAICINGELLKGADGAAGEIGHIAVLGQTEMCGCGNPGCIELTAGGKYLEKVADAKGVGIKKIFVQLPDDPDVLRYLDAAAIAITAEVNILNPHNIVLGGGVPGMEGFPREKLLELIKVHARKPYPHDTLNIRWSEEADMNGVIGGGIYAHTMLKNGGNK